jgi:hypothetical protein
MVQGKPGTRVEGRGVKLRVQAWGYDMAGQTTLAIFKSSNSITRAFLKSLSALSSPDHHVMRN